MGVRRTKDRSVQGARLDPEIVGITAAPRQQRVVFEAFECPADVSAGTGARRVVLQTPLARGNSRTLRPWRILYRFEQRIHDGQSAPAYSACMPATFTTRAHLSTSLFMNAVNSAGESVTGMPPSATIFSFMPGDFSI